MKGRVKNEKRESKHISSLIIYAYTLWIALTKTYKGIAFWPLFFWAVLSEFTSVEVSYLALLAAYILLVVARGLYVGRAVARTYRQTKQVQEKFGCSFVTASYAVKTEDISFDYIMGLSQQEFEQSYMSYAR